MNTEMIEKTTNNELETEQIEKLEGEIVLNEEGKKVLRITRDAHDLSFMGALDCLAQTVNIAGIVSNIEKTVEYVVQIPAKYQQQLETGEYFINRNQKTGIEWPTLMKKAENGRYQFVDDLPIKQQEFMQGNPFQEICNSYHNIVMQRQLAQISETVQETYQTVKMIEQGQQDDRLSRIDTGREQILLAMTLKNETEKIEMLRSGTQNLLLGKDQIGKALLRRVEAFKALPDSKAKMYFATITQPDYLSKKDSEVEAIQECYSMYIEATKMIGAIFAYEGETAAVERTFKKSIEFLEDIDFSDVKTIDKAHIGVDLSDWFFNHPVEYVEAERQACIGSSREYDYVEIEVTGEELLEAMKDGRQISEEDAK